MERQTADVPVDGEEGTVGGENSAAAWEEGQAHERRAAEKMFGMTLGSDANDAAAAAKGGDDKEILVLVEGEALRAAEAAIEDMDFAILGDAIDAVIAGRGGAADVEFAAWVEGEVVGGDGWLESGEDENFALRADFENGAAAVADKEIAFCIEGEAGGNAHAFDPLFAAAVVRNSIDGAVVAAGNEEVAVRAEREAGGIDERCDEGFYVIAGVDRGKRNGDGL